jgi:hypothetical protein
VSWLRVEAESDAAGDRDVVMNEEDESRPAR